MIQQVPHIFAFMISLTTSDVAFTILHRLNPLASPLQKGTRDFFTSSTLSPAPWFLAISLFFVVVKNAQMQGPNKSEFRKLRSMKLWRIIRSTKNAKSSELPNFPASSFVFSIVPERKPDPKPRSSPGSRRQGGETGRTSGSPVGRRSNSCSGTLLKRTSVTLSAAGTRRRECSRFLSPGCSAGGPSSASPWTKIWRILPHQRAPCLAEKLAARVGGLGFLRTLDGG